MFVDGILFFMELFTDFHGWLLLLIWQITTDPKLSYHSFKKRFKNLDCHLGCDQTKGEKTF